jgi:hypothetical protein
MNAQRAVRYTVAALLAGTAAAGAMTAGAQREPSLNTVSPAAAKCPECAIVRSVREIRRTRSSPIGTTARDERYYRGPFQTGYVAPTLVGPTVGIAFGPGVSDPRPAVGARGTRSYLLALEDETLEVTVQNPDGSFSRFEEPLDSAWLPGDRVRVVDGLLERP